MRITLIKRMLLLQRVHKRLPKPYDHRSFFTAQQMAKIIGRPRRPAWADGSALRLLGWTRTVRRINGIAQRVWFPPQT